MESPHAPPQSWPVLTCNDTTVPGSLRYIASHALTGDTIDFSQLPTLCGMTDSTITLTAGEIVLHQQDITLSGPPAGTGTVTLSGGGQSRVLRHQVYGPYVGTLRVDDLRIVDGHAEASASIGGGCIYSDADNVYLTRSLVEGCVAHSSMGNANGAGVDAPNGKISLAWSRVSGNTASIEGNGFATGGGTSSHSLVAKYSEIVGNSAPGAFSTGGGVWTKQASVAYSTIANNTAGLWGGGIFEASAGSYVEVTNSTFSGNHAYDIGGAIHARVDNLQIFNSTIASNSTDAAHSGGIYFKGTTAHIESTIVATNTSATLASGTDIYLASGGMLTGADNAVMSSNVIPAAGVVVLTEDPKLSPLAWIGGTTRTMNLLPGSSAIGIGNNSSNRPFEQRGPGFPRTTGPAADVDIGAVQSSDRIFVSDLDSFFL